MKMREEIERHLREDLLPFWMKMKDEENGGFFGEMDGELHIHKTEEKGCILNSRILWFFSNVCTQLRDEESLEYAAWAYTFLKESFWDKEQGGVYWSVTYDGQPADTSKHTYCQAFAVYGLSSYYAASGDREALDTAMELFRLIEEKCKDKYGYLESFTREFQLEDNEKLSENGVMAEKTMNTILHVFEAYTELYKVMGTLEELKSAREQVGRCLREILEILEKKIYHPGKRRQEVFFDKRYHSILDLHSYGHDIETAWLVEEGCTVLGDEEYTKKMQPMIRELTNCVYEKAFTGDSLYNECCKGEVDKTRVWWVQAEGVNGFLNAYEKEPDQRKYLEAAERIWEYIKEHLLDSRTGSEWFWSVDDQGVPNKDKGLVNMWKCPYHNGRMCLEVMRRVKA